MIKSQRKRDAMGREHANGNKNWARGGNMGKGENPKALGLLPQQFANWQKNEKVGEKRPLTWRKKWGETPQ